MNEVSEAVAGWLEKKRRMERTTASVLSVLALVSGVAVFLVAALLIFTILSVFSGAFARPAPGLGLVALALAAGSFVLSMRGRGDRLDFDPMGFWIFKEIWSFGPRLLLEGLRECRLSADLGQLDVAACTRALAYLAKQNGAITWEELILQSPQLSSERLKQQLSLLDGVLFLGKDASRVVLMEPFRLRLRSMLEPDQRTADGPEPTRPRPEPSERVMPVNEPETLSAYELLGLSPSASMAEIKMAYRKRMKECHPDLFAGMDQRARALAERWTKALNAAYASLNPRHQRDRSARER